MHQVVEVYELTNDTSVTAVSAGADRPVWSIRLPARAVDAAVGEGDLRPDVVAFRDGRVDLHAPFAPGLRQLTVHYMLPARAFPLAVEIVEAPDVLEVLLADPAGRATGVALHEERPAMLEGVRYRRYLSQRPTAGGTFTVDVRRVGLTPERAVPWLVGAVVVAFAAAHALARRRVGRPLPVHA